MRFELGSLVTVKHHPNRVFVLLEKMPENRVALDDGDILIFCFEDDLTPA